MEASKVGDNVVNTEAPETWGHGVVIELTEGGARVRWWNGRIGDHFWSQLALSEHHLSDCAQHNEPAEPNGPCDCGAYSHGG